jgi:hypothetical protein
LKKKKKTCIPASRSGEKVNALVAQAVSGMDPHDWQAKSLPPFFSFHPHQLVVVMIAFFFASLPVSLSF